ncbi:MAG TPA: hypothetical protein DCO77_02645 [Nitrospiraceae bacterium]|nr:hypothetical protein [Nitrospiraceae bacterium]
MARVKRIGTAFSTWVRQTVRWWGGIGCRVSFFVTIALVLAASLVGVFFMGEGKRVLDEEIRGRAIYVARYLAALTLPDMQARNARAIDDKIIPALICCSEEPSERDLLYVLVYDHSGNLITGRTRTERIPPGRPRLSLEFSPGNTITIDSALNTPSKNMRTPSFQRLQNGVYDVIHPVVVSEKRVGFIRTGISGQWHARKYLDIVKKGALALVAILVLGLVISQILAASITRPISRLSAAAEDLGRQNWNAPIPVQGKDEISRLSHAFNQMALTLKQRETSLSRGNRDLFILHTAGLDLMESLDVESLLEKIAARAEDLVRADTITISAVDKNEKMLKYIGAFGSKAQTLLGGDVILEAGGIYNWIVSYGTPLLILDAQSDFRFEKAVMESLGIRCLMAVPLWSSNSMVGLLTAINKKGGACFDKHDLRLFTVFSNLISAALQNANLYSDLKNNVHKLEQTQEQLVRSTRMAAVGELAANIAHEINNPLTSVLGYTTHLLKTLDMQEEPKRMLEMMEQETLRVRKIIRNLLDYSRKRQAWMQPADLLQPLKETLALVQGIAESSSVRIREEYDGQEFIVSMDSNEMKQVFINLVNNALQAMPEGGELTVRADRQGQREAVVAFSDTGNGIPRDDMGKIFEPFFTARGDGSGTGLGLPISERIVLNHNGRIEVDSEAGKGSVFKVILPLHREAPSAER